MSRGRHEERTFTKDSGTARGRWSPTSFPGAESLGRNEMLDYIRFVDSLVDPTVDKLNLDSDETGISWYPNISKLSHQLMNLRHIQGHVGQLSEASDGQRDRHRLGRQVGGLD